MARKKTEDKKKIPAGRLIFLLTLLVISAVWYLFTFR